MPAKKAAVLSLEQITAKIEAGRDPIDVDVPEWGGTVQVRPLSLQQINVCTRKATDELRGLNLDVRNGWYLVEGMVQPQITLKEAEVWLSETGAGPVARILGEILYRSGMTERAAEAAKSSAED